MPERGGPNPELPEEWFAGLNAKVAAQRDRQAANAQTPAERDEAWRQANIPNEVDREWHRIHQPTEEERAERERAQSDAHAATQNPEDAGKLGWELRREQRKAEKEAQAHLLPEKDQAQIDKDEAWRRSMTRNEYERDEELRAVDAREGIREAFEGLDEHNREREARERIAAIHGDETEVQQREREAAADRILVGYLNELEERKHRGKVAVVPMTYKDATNMDVIENVIDRYKMVQAELIDNVDDAPPPPNLNPKKVLSRNILAIPHRAVGKFIRKNTNITAGDSPTQNWEMRRYLVSESHPDLVLEQYFHIQRPGRKGEAGRQPGDVVPVSARLVSVRGGAYERKDDGTFKGKEGSFKRTDAMDKLITIPLSPGEKYQPTGPTVDNFRLRPSGEAPANGENHGDAGEHHGGHGHHEETFELPYAGGIKPQVRSFGYEGVSAARAEVQRVAAERAAAAQEEMTRQDAEENRGKYISTGSRPTEAERAENILGDERALDAATDLKAPAAGTPESPTPEVRAPEPAERHSSSDSRPSDAERAENIFGDARALDAASSPVQLEELFRAKPEGGTPAPERLEVPTSPEQASGAEAPKEYSVDPGSLAEGEVSVFSQVVARSGIEVPTAAVQLNEAQVDSLISAARSEADLEAVQREVQARSGQLRQDRVRDLERQGKSREADNERRKARRGELTQREKPLSARISATIAERKIIDREDLRQQHNDWSRSSSANVVNRRGERVKDDTGASHAFDTAEGADEDVREKANRGRARIEPLSPEAPAAATGGPVPTTPEAGEVGTAGTETGASEAERENLIAQIEGLRDSRMGARRRQDRLHNLLGSAIKQNILERDAKAPLGVKAIEGSSASAEFLRRVESAQRPRAAEEVKRPVEERLADMSGRLEALAQQDLDPDAKQEQLNRLLDEAAREKILRRDPRARLGFGSRRDVPGSREFIQRVRESFPAQRSNTEVPPAAPGAPEEISQTEEASANEVGVRELAEESLAAASREELSAVRQKAVDLGLIEVSEEGTKPRDVPGAEALYNNLRETDADISSYSALRRYLTNVGARPGSALEAAKNAYAPERAHETEYEWTADAVEEVLSGNPPATVVRNLERQLIAASHIVAIPVEEGEESDLRYLGEKVRLEAVDEVGAKALGEEPEAAEVSEEAAGEQTGEQTGEPEAGDDLGDVLQNWEPVNEDDDEDEGDDKRGGGADRRRARQARENERQSARRRDSGEQSES